MLQNNLKKTILLFFLFQLFLFCKGADNNNAHARPHGSELKGCISKAIIYICPVLKHGIIPADTSGFTSRITKIYDSMGNLSAENSFYKLNDSSIEHLTSYTGAGKDRTFTERYLSGFEDKKERTYQYVWADDYHFKITPADPSGFTVLSELDTNFRTIRSVYMREGTILISDEFSYRETKDKLYEKVLKRTIKEGDSERIIQNVTVTQEYDQYGNPTLTYIYDDVGKRKLANISFTIYEYCNEDTKHPKPE